MGVCWEQWSMMGPKDPARPCREGQPARPSHPWIWAVSVAGHSGSHTQYNRHAPCSSHRQDWLVHPLLWWVLSPWPGFPSYSTTHYSSPPLSIVTHCQPSSEKIEWKIPELIPILNCTQFWVSLWNLGSPAQSRTRPQHDHPFAQRLCTADAPQLLVTE